MKEYDPIDDKNEDNIEKAVTINAGNAKQTRLKKLKIVLSIVASIATIIGVVLGVYFNVNRNNAVNTLNNSNNIATANTTITSGTETSTKTSNSVAATTSSNTSNTFTTTTSSSASPSVTIAATTSSVVSNSTVCTNGGGVQVQIMQSGWCMTDWYNGACKLVYPKSGSTTQVFSSSFTNWKVGGCYMSAGDGLDTWFNVSCNNGPWVSGRCTMLYSNSKDCLAIWDDGWSYNPGTCSHFKDLQQPL